MARAAFGYSEVHSIQRDGSFNYYFLFSVAILRPTKLNHSLTQATEQGYSTGTPSSPRHRRNTFRDKSCQLFSSFCKTPAYPGKQACGPGPSAPPPPFLQMHTLSSSQTLLTSVAGKPSAGPDPEPFTSPAWPAVRSFTTGKTNLYLKHQHTTGSTGKPTVTSWGVA